MDLFIPGTKNGTIQKILIWKMLVLGKELRMEEIYEGCHGVTTTHVFRKNHISICYTYLQELLCSFIRLWVLT